MNRLSPLIARPMLAAYLPLPARWDGIERRKQPSNAMREFLTTWLGGVVFFGTFLA